MEQWLRTVDISTGNLPVVTSLTVAINDSPLAARVHQSGANMNDPLAAWVHQGEVDDAINPIWAHQIDTI